MNNATVETIEKRVAKMYADMNALAITHGDRIKRGYNVLYGPPMVKPKLMLISFQPGGEDGIAYQTYPDTLAYVKDNFKFGKTLRKHMQEAGLSDVLEKHTVATTAVFAQAPASESSKWATGKGSYKIWREFSLESVRELIDLMHPEVIVIFGTKTKDIFKPELTNTRHNHKQHILTYGEGELEGIPLVYCMHLSQGWVASEVQKSFRKVKELLACR